MPPAPHREMAERGVFVRSEATSLGDAPTSRRAIGRWPGRSQRTAHPARSAHRSGPGRDKPRPHPPPTAQRAASPSTHAVPPSTHPSRCGAAHEIPSRTTGTPEAPTEPADSVPRCARLALPHPAVCSCPRGPEPAARPPGRAPARIASTRESQPGPGHARTRPATPQGWSAAAHVCRILSCPDAHTATVVA